MLPASIKAKIGDCEACDKTNIKVIFSGHNMWLCETCYAGEKEVERQIVASAQIIESSRKMDESVRLDVDLFNASTVAFMELNAAIDADESVPADQKQYVKAKACQERMLHFQKVVFDKRQELLGIENEMRAWQVRTQEAAGKLRADKQAEFKNLDINYTPVTPKKPKAVPTTKKKFDLEAIKAAAKKYDVDATMIQMMLTSKLYKSEEEAAQALARTK